MAQVIAGLLYLFMAALLVVFYERHVAVFIPSRRWRIFLRALAAVLLFTPGLISASGEIYPVPASVAALPSWKYGPVSWGGCHSPLSGVVRYSFVALRIA